MTWYDWIAIWFSAAAIVISLWSIYVHYLKKKILLQRALLDYHERGIHHGGEMDVTNGEVD